MKLPAQLDPESITAIIDSREQTPLNLEPLQTVVKGLDTGDYSIAGMEHLVALERKSLGDLVACCGAERDRFSREVQRLLAYPCRALVIESTWPEIEMGAWRGRLTPAQVIGSLLSWQAQGLPLMLCGDHARAGRMTSRLLFTFARHRYRELRLIAQGIDSPAITSRSQPTLNDSNPKQPSKRTSGSVSE